MSLAATFLSMCFIISAVGSVSSKPESVTAIWSVDLRTAVGTDPLGIVVGRSQEHKARANTSLWFADDRTVVATFVTREGEPQLASHQADDENLPLRLKLISADAATGKVVSVSSLPAKSSYSQIVAAPRGRLVVQTSNDLALYSSDLHVLKRVTLPPVQDGDWKAYPSPTGESVLFVPPGHTTGKWIWMKTDTLEFLQSWEDTQSGDVSIADDKIGMVTCTWQGTCEPKVAIRSLSGTWITIAQGALGLRPQFVNQDMLFLEGQSRKILRTDGTIISSDKASYQPCSWGVAFPSHSGHRLVVPGCRTQGRVASLDVGGEEVLEKIVIYDAASGWQPYSLSLKGPKLKGLSRIALSADGSRLAILNNETVQILKLPPPAS